MLERYASLLVRRRQASGREPSCPVAAAERGRQVLVHSGTSFQVTDHDFTRFSIIPLIALLVDIPDKISGP